MANAGVRGLRFLVHIHPRGVRGISVRGLNGLGSRCSAGIGDVGCVNGRRVIIVRASAHAFVTGNCTVRGYGEFGTSRLRKCQIGLVSGVKRRGFTLLGIGTTNAAGVASFRCRRLVGCCGTLGGGLQGRGKL